MDEDTRHPGTKSVGWALVQAARLHRSRTGDKLSDLGLFAGQEQVLQALAMSGPTTMGDLATILRVRPPTASKTISRLSALKLVERHTEPGDARIVRVKLTKEGKRKAEAINALWDEVESELLARFRQQGSQAAAEAPAQGRQKPGQAHRGRSGRLRG